MDLDCQPFHQTGPLAFDRSGLSNKYVDVSSITWPKTNGGHSVAARPSPSGESEFIPPPLPLRSRSTQRCYLIHSQCFNAALLLDKSLYCPSILGKTRRGSIVIADSGTRRIQSVCVCDRVKQTNRQPPQLLLLNEEKATSFALIVASSAAWTKSSNCYRYRRSTSACTPMNVWRP